MSHTDPLFAIPAGVAVLVGSVCAATRPEAILELHGGGLRRLFGDRGATIVLRASGIVTAGLTGWLVVHASLTLLGTG